MLGGRALSQVPVAPSALAQLRESYLAAYNAGDAEAMKTLYVADAVRMPYDAPAQVGREAIVAYYRQAFARRRFVPTLTFVVDDVQVRGNVAVERGHYREALRPQTGGGTLLEVGKYVAVAKGADGRWRYETSIFNRDAAPGRLVLTPKTYRPTGGVERCLESRGGTRLQVLLDRAGLGGNELELARITCPPGLPPRVGHRHGAVEILYVLTGTLDHVVNDTGHVLERGMVGVVRPGDEVIHRVSGAEPVEALVIWAPAGELGRIEASFAPCADR